MSTAVRQAIASAATTVAGVDVSPYYRQTRKQGAGYVRLDQIAYPNPFGGVCTWQILINLPTGLADAEEFIDDKLPALRAALADEVTVRMVRPITLQFDTVQVPALEIQATREEE